MAKRDVYFSSSLPEGRNSKNLRTVSWMSELKSRPFPSYFKLQREEDVLNSLEVIETDVLLGEPIRWNVLHRLIRAMRLCGKEAPDCLKFLTELLRLFQRYQCKDESLVSEVFLDMRFLTTCDLASADQNVELCKWFYEPYVSEQSAPELVWNAARCANLGLLKLHLKFGIGMMNPYFTFGEQFESSEILHLLRLVIAGVDRIQGKETGEKLSSNFNPESRKRLHLVLRTLEIVRTMQENAGFREYFDECYRLLFDSIPEPYITSAEVKDSLEKCLPDTCSRSISQVAEAFNRLLPKLAEVPQPRSLQHLCRIRVRRSLHQSLNLPHGVSQLPLPTDLKEYIMLHDDGDYSIIMRISLEANFWTDPTVRLRPLSVIDIPKRDDFITLFIKSL